MKVVKHLGKHETGIETWDRNTKLGQEGIKYKMKLFLITGESSVTVRQAWERSVYWRYSSSQVKELEKYNSY